MSAEEWDSDPEFKAMRDEFIASFAERRSKLEVLLQDIALGKDLTTHLGSARFIAHKLAGAAASYGFPILTEVAAAYEDWIAQRGTELEGTVRFGKLLIEMLQSAETMRIDPVNFEADLRFESLRKEMGGV